MIDTRHGWTFSFKPQFIGFVLSILLTVAVYRVVVHRELTEFLLVATVTTFCVLQALIQLFFFHHIGMESKPHWITITFLFTLLVLVIIVGGTLWIMSNLNYNLMPSMPTMGH